MDRTCFPTLSSALSDCIGYQRDHLLRKEPSLHALHLSTYMLVSLESS